MQSSKLNHFHGFLFGTGDSLGILDFNFTKSGEIGNFDHFLGVKHTFLTGSFRFGAT